jgi:pimeloyl-ACP methyl ester carboxylesterase
MSGQIRHNTVAEDGTTIRGRVDGQGPPLVIVPAGPSDGELEWGPMFPFLRERFTCYVMDRGSRARNTDLPDHSLERSIGDVVVFIESVDEPVGVLGGSWSGMLSLGAARRTSAVSALAVWEPIVIEAVGEQQRAQMDQALSHVRQLVDEGHHVEAVRTWHASNGIVSEDELAAIPNEFFDALAPTFATQVEEYRQAGEFPGPTPTDPAELAAVTAPVLLLYGDDSMPLFIDGIDHVAAHLADAAVHTIPGVGHSGCLFAPAAVADVLTPFFAAVLDPT